MFMNRLFQPSADVLLFRLSDAAERYTVRNGNFKVLYGTKQERRFPDLLDAFIFYLSVNEEALLLDGDKNNAVIERKVHLCLN